MASARTREDIAEAIRSVGVLAIIRLDDSSALVRVAEAICAGGLPIVEFTMNTPGALEAIEELVSKAGDEVLVGAGTVLDEAAAEAAIGAGAEFIVSPSTDAGVIAAAHRHGKVAMPGAYTPTEIMRAMQLDADFVKLFPAHSLGPSYIKAVKAPLPDAPIVPTGGITLDNAAEYIKAGAEAIAVGGELVNKALIEKGDFDAITRMATRFSETVAFARRA